MDQTHLFDHLNYREYLRKQFPGKGILRGRRALLARHLRCQTSFISLVLTDRAHLSLEYAFGTASFLKFSESETEYFLLLVQKERAGNKDLREFFENQIGRVHRQRESIRERINVRTELSAEDQMQYYSTWHYAAIHIMCALPGLNSIEAISTRLKLEVSVVKAAIAFLEERGFVVNNGGLFSIGSRRIHLPHGSLMLPRHHANWRMKAIEAVDFEKSDDVHYSAVLGIAKKDIKTLKEMLLRLLRDFETVIQDSKEEVPVVFVTDLFEL